MAISEPKFFEFIKKSTAEVFEKSETYSYATKHYLKKFKKHPTDFFYSWNWAAFFFGAGWLAFRKMYGKAIWYFAIFLLYMITCFFIVGFALEDFTRIFHPYAIYLATIPFMIIFAILGDYIYIKSTYFHIENNALHKSGTSWWGGILATLLLQLYYGIMYFVMFAVYFIFFFIMLGLAFG